MKGTESKVLIDSSVWLAYFLKENKKSAEIIDNLGNLLFTSVISLHEIKKRLLREKLPKPEIEADLDFVKKNSIIVELTPEIAEKSADDCIAHELYTVDAIIYRSAIEYNAMLVTGDGHFRDLENIMMID